MTYDHDRDVALAIPLILNKFHDLGSKRLLFVPLISVCFLLHHRRTLRMPAFSWWTQADVLHISASNLLQMIRLKAGLLLQQAFRESLYDLRPPLQAASPGPI